MLEQTAVPLLHSDIGMSFRTRMKISPRYSYWGESHQYESLHYDILYWYHIPGGGGGGVLGFSFAGYVPLASQSPCPIIRHRYDDIIMGFYVKAFHNGLQAKAAGSKPILFPANQNLGRSGLYHS